MCSYIVEKASLIGSAKGRRLDEDRHRARLLRPSRSTRRSTTRSPSTSSTSPTAAASGSRSRSARRSARELVRAILAALESGEQEHAAATAAQATAGSGNGLGRLTASRDRSLVAAPLDCRSAACAAARRRCWNSRRSRPAGADRARGPARTPTWRARRNPPRCARPRRRAGPSGARSASSSTSPPS